VAQGQLAIGGVGLQVTTAMIPGEQLGWEGTLAFSLDDPKHVELLGKLNKMRKKKYGTEDRRYVPVRVIRGKVEGAVMVTDLPSNDKRRHKLHAGNSQGTTPDMVEGTNTKTLIEVPRRDENNAEEVGAEVVGEGAEQGVEGASEEEEAEGDSSQDDGNRTTDIDKPGLAGTQREEIIRLTREDETLKAARRLADREMNGYLWDEGLLFRHTLDQLGNVCKRLCVPKTLRPKCLIMAHERAGHLGKNKVGKSLSKWFHWPIMYSDTATHCTSCEVCQKFSKSKPRHTPMVEREVVTIPFERVAIDLVGPLPKARGGYEFMLTCIDLASRWLEAVALKKTTATIVVHELLEVFSRNGFPGTIVSESLPPFAGKMGSPTPKRVYIAHRAMGWWRGSMGA